MHPEISALPGKLAATPHLLRLGQLVNETVLLKIDSEEYYLMFDKGHLAGVHSGPSKKIPYRVALVTDADAMARFWQARPAAGFHDIFALAKIGRLEILGDILYLVKNLRFFKELLALPREVHP